MYWLVALICAQVPSPDDAESEAVAWFLLKLDAQRVPQLLLLILTLVSEDHQTHTLRSLPQNIDTLIMRRHTQIYAIHLRETVSYEMDEMKLAWHQSASQKSRDFTSRIWSPAHRRPSLDAAPSSYTSWIIIVPWTQTHTVLMNQFLCPCEKSVLNCAEWALVDFKSYSIFILLIVHLKKKM